MITEKTVKFPNLHAEMARHGHVQSTIGQLLGLTKSAVNRRFIGEKDWTKTEIDTICDFYGKEYSYLFSN